MKAMIQLAELTSAQQLCLQAAVRCGGLQKTDAGYVPRFHHEREIARPYDAVTVGALMLRELLTSSRTHSMHVLATDTGMELLDYGRVAREVAR
ncbi:hypothetical protein [Xanthomonas campestris]|uniref:hypothetical protein n=1 Tax=Xanthomonas campestris TaxID=339 RepID=UPI000D45AF2C|nr:hypothetical protein [Xanthomonas campestris]